MSTADELLDAEPELKALAVAISKRNVAFNSSIKLIQYFLDHVDMSILQTSECKELTEQWIQSQRNAFELPE